MSPHPSTQLPLQSSPSAPPDRSITLEDGSFDPQTYISTFQIPQSAPNDELFHYNYNFDEAGEGAGDDIDGTTVNYDIPSPPVDQTYDTLEIAL